MTDHDPIHCPITEVVDIAPEVLAELTPLLVYLQSNRGVGEPTSFPRGTVLADGRLDLCKQQLGPTGCRLVTEALAANATITSVLIGTNAIGDQGAADVANLVERNNHLEVVYLGCNRITAAGAGSLAQALANDDHVVGLWLKRNPIGPSGARAIAAMLRHNRHLRTLDLVNTQVGADGLAAILDVLIHHNRTVERIYLGGNQIDAESAGLLADLLVENPAITALLLNVNHLGDAGARSLARALGRNQTLVELGLASNGIGAAGGAALLAAIHDHPALENVDFGYSASTRVLGARENTLGDAGMPAVGVMLAHNRTLLRLDLRRNGMTEVGKQTLLAALEGNTTLQQLMIDGKQDRRIAELLERNRALSPRPRSHLARDVALIRSVYRTA